MASQEFGSLVANLSVRSDLSESASRAVNSAGFGGCNVLLESEQSLLLGSFKEARLLMDVKGGRARTLRISFAQKK